jgi:putative endopeptidase
VTLLRVAGLGAALTLVFTGFARVQAAEYGFLVANVDRTCKPCEDFFRFAMGGWESGNPIPPTASRWSVLDELRQQNRIALRGVLDNAARQGAPRGTPAQKASDYYTSCMNVVEREAAGTAPIAAYLRAITSISGTSDVRLETAVLQNIGVKAFFFAGSEIDPGNGQSTIAFISQGGLGLPDRDLYFAPDARAAQIREQYLG